MEATAISSGGLHRKSMVEITENCNAKRKGGFQYIKRSDSTITVPEDRVQFKTTNFP